MPDDPSEQINIEIITSASVRDLKALYQDAGWWKSSYDKNPDFLSAVVEKSALFAGAFLDKKMIGMGRALSDLSSDAYIQDVVVLKPYRGKGIGKKIILLLVETLKKNGVDWIGLVAEPGTSKFYEQMGFSPLKGHTPLRYEE